jgi:hypothetical protein
MGPEFFGELRHFVTTTLAYALALMAMMILLWFGRRVGWRWPIDFLEWLVGAGSHAPERTVNVEYRDASGIAADLGPLVTGTLRNGRGGLFELHEGCFVGCHPDVIRAGGVVVINIQERVKETLRVQLDLEKQTLFVESRFTQSELVKKINR